MYGRVGCVACPRYQIKLVRPTSNPATLWGGRTDGFSCFRDGQVGPVAAGFRTVLTVEQNTTRWYLPHPSCSGRGQALLLIAGIGH